MLALTLSFNCFTGERWEKGQCCLPAAICFHLIRVACSGLCRWVTIFREELNEEFFYQIFILREEKVHSGNLKWEDLWEDVTQVQFLPVLSQMWSLQEATAGFRNSFGNLRRRCLSCLHLKGGLFLRSLLLEKSHLFLWLIIIYLKVNCTFIYLINMITWLQLMTKMLPRSCLICSFCLWPALKSGLRAEG